jgi:hypothetical protein
MEDMGDGLVNLTGEDINYAEWEILESFLRDRKIEFDKDWASGGDYEAGNSYARLIKGKYKEYEIYSTQVSILETLLDIKEKLEDDPVKALKDIKKQIKSLHPFDADPLYKPNSKKFIIED